MLYSLVVIIGIISGGMGAQHANPTIGMLVQVVKV